MGGLGLGLGLGQAPQGPQGPQAAPLYAAMGSGRWGLARAMLMACPQHAPQLMRDLHWQARRDALLAALLGRPFVRPSEARAEALRDLAASACDDRLLAANPHLSGDGNGGSAPGRSAAASRRSSNEKLGVSGAALTGLLQVLFLSFFHARRGTSVPSRSPLRAPRLRPLHPLCPLHPL